LRVGTAAIFGTSPSSVTGVLLRREVLFDTDLAEAGVAAAHLGVHM